MALSEAEFLTLVDEHAPALYRLAYRLSGDAHEAEDLVQETYRSAWTARQRYQKNLGARAWLAAILRRRSVDRWRKRSPIPMDGGSLTEIGAAEEPPLNDGFTDEMQAALARLPEELRETLLLVVVGELTHQEAADLLGVPLGTVLSRVSRARTRLREYLTAARSYKS